MALLSHDSSSSRGTQQGELDTALRIAALMCLLP